MSVRQCPEKMAPLSPRTSNNKFRRRLLNYTTSALDVLDAAKDSADDIVKAVKEGGPVDALAFAKFGRALYDALRLCSDQLAPVIDQVSHAVVVLKPEGSSAGSEIAPRARNGALAAEDLNIDAFSIDERDDSLLQRYCAEQVASVSQKTSVATVREPSPLPQPVIQDGDDDESTLSSEGSSKRIKLEHDEGSTGTDSNVDLEHTAEVETNQHREELLGIKRERSASAGGLGELVADSEREVTEEEINEYTHERQEEQVRSEDDNKNFHKDLRKCLEEGGQQGAVTVFEYKFVPLESDENHRDPLDVGVVSPSPQNEVDPLAPDRSDNAEGEGSHKEHPESGEELTGQNEVEQREEQVEVDDSWRWFEDFGEASMIYEYNYTPLENYEDEGETRKSREENAASEEGHLVQELPGVVKDEEVHDQQPSSQEEVDKKTTQSSEDGDEEEEKQNFEQMAAVNQGSRGSSPIHTQRQREESQEQSNNLPNGEIEHKQQLLTQLAKGGQQTPSKPELVTSGTTNTFLEQKSLISPPGLSAEDEESVNLDDLLDSSTPKNDSKFTPAEAKCSKEESDRGKKVELEEEKKQKEELDPEEALKAQVLADLDSTSSSEREEDQSSSDEELAVQQSTNHQSSRQKAPAQSSLDASLVAQDCTLPKVHVMELPDDLLEEIQLNGSIKVQDWPELLGEKQLTKEEKEEAEIRRLLRPIRFPNRRLDLSEDSGEESDDEEERELKSERPRKKRKISISPSHSSTDSSSDSEDQTTDDDSSSEEEDFRRFTQQAASFSDEDQHFVEVRDMLAEMNSSDEEEQAYVTAVDGAEVNQEDDADEEERRTPDADLSTESVGDDDGEERRTPDADLSTESVGDDDASAITIPASPPAKKPRTEAALMVDRALARFGRTGENSSAEETTGATPVQESQRREPLRDLNGQRGKKRQANARRRRFVLSTSDSSSDEENRPPKKKKSAPTSKESEAGTEEVDSSDSDFFIPERKQRKARSKKTPEVVLLSDTDSQASSDSEADEPVVKQENMEVDENAEVQQASQNSGTGTRRRNIKKIIDDRDLSTQTKEVMRDEEERIRRLREKEKAMEKIQQDFFPDKDAPTAEKFVLDVDPDTENPTVVVHDKLNEILKPHQREGVKFMFDTTVESLKLVKEGHQGGGSILAHCMGLGKTLQVITLVHTLMTHEELGLKKFLILCPKNALSNWVHEFWMWLDAKGLGDLVPVYRLEDGFRPATRVKRVKEWYQSGGVFVMSYSEFGPMLNDNARNNRWKEHLEVMQEYLMNPGPDFVVCDEGHILKNDQTICFKALFPMRTKRRVMLTGTPLQNNLEEYYSMVQLVKRNLLGTKKEFMNRFVHPINNGSLKDSSHDDVTLMRNRSFVLHKKLEPIVQRMSYAVLRPYLPNKLEYVVQVKLTPLQEKLYRGFLGQINKEGGIGGEGTNRRVRVLPDFHVFTRVWNHPALLTMESTCQKRKRVKRAKAAVAEQAELESMDEDGGVNLSAVADKLRDQCDNWWKTCIEEGEDIHRIEHSSKFMVFLDILLHCQNRGDKLVLFSTSRMTLDLVEKMLGQVAQLRQAAIENGTKASLERTNFIVPEKPARWENYIVEMGEWRPRKDYLRIDGSTSTKDRDRIRDVFNNPKSPANLLLVSTKAGGIGVNLVGANRAVIMDVNWNPSHDVQALFRIYRIGQTREVFVYRLVAGGCMEDKIYSRCVSKLSLSGRVVDEHQIRRHYTNSELQELYNLDPPLSLADADGIPDLPKDTLLADILLERKEWITGYHDHDSLLENRVEESLDEDEKKKAWDEYEKDHSASLLRHVLLPEPMPGLLPRFSPIPEEDEGSASDEDEAGNPASYLDAFGLVKDYQAGNCAEMNPRVEAVVKAALEAARRQILVDYPAGGVPDGMLDRCAAIRVAEKFRRGNSVSSSASSGSS